MSFKLLIVLAFCHQCSAVLTDYVVLSTTISVDSEVFVRNKSLELASIYNSTHLVIRNENCEELVVKMSLVADYSTFDVDENERFRCGIYATLHRNNTTKRRKKFTFWRPIRTIYLALAYDLIENSTVLFQGWHGKDQYETKSSYPVKLDTKENAIIIYNEKCVERKIDEDEVLLMFEILKTSTDVLRCNVTNRIENLIQFNQANKLELQNLPIVDLRNLTSKAVKMYPKLNPDPNRSPICETSTVTERVRSTTTVFRNRTAQTKTEKSTILFTVPTNITITERISVPNITTTEKTTVTEIIPTKLTEILTKYVPQTTTITDINTYNYTYTDLINVTESVTVLVPSFTTETITETETETVNAYLTKSETFTITSTEIKLKTYNQTLTKINHVTDIITSISPSYITETSTNTVTDLLTTTKVEFWNVTETLTIATDMLIMPTTVTQTLEMTSNCTTKVFYDESWIQRILSKKNPLKSRNKKDIKLKNLISDQSHMNPWFLRFGVPMRRVEPVENSSTIIPSPTSTMTMPTMTTTTVIHQTIFSQMDGSSQVTIENTTQKPIERISPQQIENFTRPTRFDDLSYLTKAGSHGIQYNRLGRLYAFSDEFIHVMRFAFPFQNFKIPKQRNDNSCFKFIYLLPSLPNMTSSGGDSLIDILNRTCTNFETSMDQFAEQIERTATAALDEFKVRQLSRQKRFDPVTLGVAAVIGFAGWALWTTTEIASAKHDRKILHEKLAGLEEDVDKLALNMKTLGENFIGFSIEVGAALEAYDEKIELMKEFLINQTSDLRQSLNNTFQFLDDQSKVLAVMSTFSDYRLSENNLIQNSLIVLLDGIQTYENIFATLNTGRMSHALLSWSKLRLILDNIDRSFAKKFEFAIRSEEKHLYYSLPLVSYAIDAVTNDIYVSFRIPLVRQNTPRAYDLIRPQFLPFSCLNEECFKFSGTNNIISFEQKNRVWLTSILTGELMQEMDPNAMKCDYHQHKSICFTFQTNQILEPSECSEGIYSWNETKMLLGCDIKSRSMSEYQPIALGNDRYIIHRYVVPFYDLYCEDQKSVRINVNQWAELIELNKGCTIGLPTVGRLLYGPFSKPLRSEVNLTSLTFHSILLDLIQSVSNKSDEEFEKLNIPNLNIPYIKPFNLSESPLTLDWSANTLTKFTNYLYKMQLNVSGVLKDLETVVNKRSGSHGVYTLVNNLQNLISALTTAVLVFSVMNYAGIVGRVRWLILVPLRRADAIKLFNIEYEIIPLDVQTVIDAIMVAFLIAILMIVIKIAYFRKHMLTSHYGRVPIEGETSLGWTLILNMTYNRVKLCTVYRENIYLRIPVTILRNQRLRELRLVNVELTWFTVKRDKEIVLKLNEDIHIYAVDDKGNNQASEWQRIRVKVNSILWRYEPKPLALDRKFNFGQATVSITRDPYL